MSLPQLMGLSLTEGEIEYIHQVLGRSPNDVELAVIDAEWSEHCSYKSSKKILRILPTSGERVVLGPGYDAGVLQIDDQTVITMHIESHNHPSAIDPYGGAATGVGGILRDILCMGTRPIAILDALRFGRIHKSAHAKWLFRHVVRGIADYGNCTGVPTVGGEVEFDDSFERNCLVDVVCIGVGKKDQLVLASANNVGDVVILAGGKTGKDGIHGSSFASRDLGDNETEDRAAVQIPDPYTKKLLIEAVLETVDSVKIAGMKDLGGGGLATALSEIAEKGSKGIVVDVAKVHLRDEDMTSLEIMISESQERMILVVKEADIGEVRRIFDKYEVPSSIIGKVTDDGNLTVIRDKEIVARLPVSLVANAPLIEREARKPSHIDTARLIKKPELPSDFTRAFIRLLATPDIASKRWIYEQYDHEVGIRTVGKPGLDASVLRMPSGKCIAVKVDGNARHSYLDPYNGACGVLAEACRNVIAVGARPMAMVDHLQFGNPSDPEVFWSFKEAVRGFADYCRELQIPCVGGKVSFYNEDTATGRAVKPAPLAGIVGLMDSPIRSATSARKGDKVVLIGETRDEMGGSVYYEEVCSLTGGQVPVVNYAQERVIHSTLPQVMECELLELLHDCSHGGLAIALAEMCMALGVGARVTADLVPSLNSRIDEILFSESHGRFVAVCRESKIPALKELMTSCALPWGVLGQLEDDSLKIDFGDQELINIHLESMTEVYETSIPRIVGEVKN